VARSACVLRPAGPTSIQPSAICTAGHTRSRSKYLLRAPCQQQTVGSALVTPSVCGRLRRTGVRTVPSHKRWMCERVHLRIWGSTESSGPVWTGGMPRPKLDLGRMQLLVAELHGDVWSRNSEHSRKAACRCSGAVCCGSDWDSGVRPVRWAVCTDLWRGLSCFWGCSRRRTCRGSIQERGLGGRGISH
jgi:hypothetical protein